MQKAKSHISYTGTERRTIAFSFSVLLFTLSLFCLNSCIREKSEDCTQGIRVRLFAKTPCSADTLYPQLAGLRLYVFDRDDKLVVYSEEHDTVALDAAYSPAVDVNNGLFTVVAWGGLEDGAVFEMEQPQKGVTTREDLLFRLHRASQQVASIEGKRVYYGESSVVELPDPAVEGSFWVDAAIDLQEITNRITVTVDGLIASGEYEIAVESANTSMNIDGTIAGQDPVMRYRATGHEFKENILTGHFTVLKLQTGYHNTLVIHDLLNGRELYHEDLVGTILLKNPNVNLACDHDFNIQFTVTDQAPDGTYMMADITINGWPLHSYDSEL